MVFSYVDTEQERPEVPNPVEETVTTEQDSAGGDIAQEAQGAQGDLGLSTDVEDDAEADVVFYGADTQLPSAAETPATDTGANRSNPESSAWFPDNPSSDEAAPDERELHVPLHWGFYSITFDALVDDYVGMSSAFDRVWNGSASVSVSAKQPIRPNATAGIFQYVSTEPWLGKRIRYSGYIQVESMEPDSPASGFIWIRVDDVSGRVVAFQNTIGRFEFPVATWQEVSIVIEIPDDAWTLHYGANLFGSGSVWIDSLSIEEVGPEVPTTGRPYPHANFNPVPPRDQVLGAPSNLDFEQITQREDQEQ